MLRIIKKVGLLIMALTTMITMNACAELNQQTSSDVCNALSQKYGKNFVATKIGDRFNTDHAVLYLHPENDESLVFTATIDRETKEVSDNYIRRKMSLSYSEDLVKSVDSSIAEIGVSAMLTCTDPSEETNFDITADEFSEKYSLSQITFYITIKNSCVKEEAVKEIVSVVLEKQDSWDVEISALIFNISDSQFDSCVSDMAISPKINSSWFSEYDCIGNSAFTFTDGEINPGIQTITKELTGE